MMRRANKNKSAHDGKTVLDADCLPQTIAIVKGRAEALGFEVEVADLSKGLPEGVINGVVLQQPGVSGRVCDQSAVIAEAKERGALVTVAADLLALTLITPPGEQGADIAVGSTQRFGVPLFFGGPHAAYMAVPEGPGTLHARPPRRCLQGQRRRPRLPSGPADPRAAHPPREGHVQHLHRAGAAGHRVLVLRRLPRPRRTEGHRRDRPRQRPHPRRLAEGRRPRRGCTTSFFDTVTVPCPARPPRSSRPPRPGASTCAPSTPTRSASPSMKPRRRQSSPTSSSPLARSGAERLKGFDLDPAVRAHLRLPAAPGLQHAPFRDPAAALHPPPLGPRPRPGPHHDPAGLVHHEAERHGRDGSHLLAGVRLHPPLRPGLPDRGLARTDRGPRSPADRDHGLRPGLHPAQRRIPGRARRPAGDPRLPPLPRRRAAQRLPDPGLRARHQRRLRRARRHEGGRRGHGFGRHDRPRGPHRQDRGQQGRALLRS